MSTPPFSRSHQDRSAFTLIELLVVIAIMVLLIALIFSSVESSVARARAAACQSNMRQLGLGVIAFTVDNEGRLPGAYGNSANRNVRNGGPFVGKEVLIPEASYTLWLNAPDEVGTLTEYLNIGSGDARRFYRCPALPQGEFDSGIGSNGMFDYTYIKAFGGVKIYLIPSTSALRHDGRTISMPTPLFMEEDPYAWSNNMYIDPGFSNADRLGTWHPKNAGHYIAIDGSVQVIRSRNDGQGPRGFDWKAGANPNDFENTGTPFWDSNISYGQWRPGYHL